MAGFIEVAIQAPDDQKEILMAELGNYPYNNFLIEEIELKAYIAENLFNRDVITSLLNRYGLDENSFRTRVIPRENWNQKWEENYDPIVVSDQVHVRAEFHDSRNYPYEILINPKMSFGTGHHDTTFLMLNSQLGIDHQAKTVLDLGTGTGILAILAAKKGAARVVGTDIDDWSMENAAENARLNQASIEFLKGSVSETSEKLPKADILMANINKNVLIDESSDYSGLLHPAGLLLISGFYDSDREDLVEVFQQVGFTPESYQTKNSWCSILFKKG